MGNRGSSKVQNKSQQKDREKSIYKEIVENKNYEKEYRKKRGLEKEGQYPPPQLKRDLSRFIGPSCRTQKQLNLPVTTRNWPSAGVERCK